MCFFYRCKTRNLQGGGLGYGLLQGKGEDILKMQVKISGLQFSSKIHTQLSKRRKERLGAFPVSASYTSQQ